MRLLTLLAGYAVGLAVAMKVRRDAGQSKLDQKDSKKSTLDKLVDEVRDIHTSTYADVKAYVAEHFADVEDFDSLKVKVTSIIDSIAEEAETFVSSLQSKGEEKAGSLTEKVDTFFEEKEAIFDEAKNKGAELTDTTTDVVTGWIDEAKSRLLTLRDTLKAKLAETPAKKTPAKKPAARKTPAKKPQA